MEDYATKSVPMSTGSIVSHFHCVTLNTNPKPGTETQWADPLHNSRAERCVQFAQCNRHFTLRATKLVCKSLDGT